MQVKKGKAVVVARFDDGSEIECNGLVIVDEVDTSTQMEYRDGSRKTFPLSYSVFKVIRKDAAFEAGEARG